MNTNNLFYDRKLKNVAEATKTVMDENERVRIVTKELNENLGIASRNALPHEYLNDYDQALKERLDEDIQIDELSAKGVKKFVKRGFKTQKKAATEKMKDNKFTAGLYQHAHAGMQDRDEDVEERQRIFRAGEQSRRNVRRLNKFINKEEEDIQTESGRSLVDLLPGLKESDLVELMTMKEEQLEELYGKGSLEKIRDYYNMEEETLSELAGKPYGQTFTGKGKLGSGKVKKDTTWYRLRRMLAQTAAEKSNKKEKINK